MLDLNEENIRYAQKQRFNLMTTQYILVYTAKKRVKNGVLIDASSLVMRDAAWIQSCNEQIVQDEMKNPAPGEGMLRFLDAFEEELQKISQQTKEGAP